MVAEEYFARTRHEILSKLRPVEANALVKQFELYLGSPEKFLFQPVVLHADLSRDYQRWLPIASGMLQSQ